jgi:hypothetical protein
MRTFYIMGTKKKCNEDINSGQAVTAVEYTMHGADTVDLCAVKQRAVIKFWVTKDHRGNPVARSYGTWEPTKMKVE